MDLLVTAASLVIGIAAVLALYTALLHLTRKSTGTSYRFRIVRDVFVSVQSLQLCFITLSWQFQYPWLLYPFITLLFVSGPLYYMRYFMFIYPGGKIPTWLKLSLVPAVLVLIGETWFHFIAPGDKGAILQSVFDRPLSQPVTAVLAIGVLILLFQYFLLLRLEAGFMKSSRTREPVNLSIVITVFYIVDVILIAIGFILANNVVMDTGILLIGLTGITYLLFMNRYPHFYQLVAREEKQQKYKKSVLQGLSKDKIVTRLKELMGEEKIYRQPELKLDEVASLLLINPHQLSELINDYMGMNFSSYINSYRVDEAKELLIKNPDQSTLSVGLEVGFGSKPSFNNIFKQATGMTPSEYRKIV